MSDKKKISRTYTELVKQDAGQRNSNNVDTTTCFGIPGSGLPRRHCNTEFYVTLAVCSDMTVYMSVHNGRIYQNVYGRPYTCRLYACPHAFEMYIGVGSTKWDQVQFKSNGTPCNDEVMLISSGEVSKSYDKSYPFNWVFGDCFKLEEKSEYYEEDIEQSKKHQVSQYGGQSVSDSAFVNMGLLTSYNWKQEMGTSQDGKIYLCGGILYPGYTVTSDITAEAVPVTIPGLNLASFYYPGDIQKDERMSLNRPEGYLRIFRPSRDPFYLDWDETKRWRDVKNTENDRAVDEGAFENWGFRLQNGEWKRLIITGAGGVSDEEGLEGIGGANPGGSSGNSGGSSSGSGGCCCM